MIPIFLEEDKLVKRILVLIINTEKIIKFAG